MTKWILQCSGCGASWELEVSFDLLKLKSGRLYHFCPHCRRNTFHIVISRMESE